MRKKKKRTKKAEIMRCSFRIGEVQLRRFHAKAKRNGHDIDALFAAFIHAYTRSDASGMALGLVINVSEFMESVKAKDKQKN